MKMYIKPLSNKELNSYLKIQDLTEAESNHAISLLYQKIRDYMQMSHQSSDVQVHRRDPVVSVKDNYDNLLIAKNNISRSSTYTHYVDENRILRTHTSANIPGILRDLAKQDDWCDVLILLPGLAYRRDVSDKKHVGQVHMLEMWRIVKNSARKMIKKQDLLDVVKGVASVAAPGWELRIEDSPHPYTNEGIEVNALKNERDIEILECGLIKEEILENAGLNSAEYSGWALGMGLDRLVMTLKSIPDVRYLRSNNPKISKQMKDLKPYHEVSNQPAIRRDMSYSVPKGYVEEDISDDIRKALGNQQNILESVEIISETSYKELPTKIQKRLGINSNQKNILVRITLRDLERTLANAEANDIYDKIYPLINYGTGGYA